MRHHLRLFSALALLATLFAVGPLSSAQAKYAAIVVDADTGDVLFSRNADTRNYPASLTKMMTLYMAFEAIENGKLKLNQRLKVSRRAEGMAPSKLGLRRGQTIKAEDVILALVTKSANDAAVVMAEALGGTEIKFAQMMTKRARQLGMKRTTFKNASGLPNRGQLSTARDMSKLGKALMRDFPQYYSYFSTTRFTYNKRKYKNHNKLLSSYKGTDGIKTGYTRASGFNLVASVERNGRRLIGVVFGGRTGKSRDRHMKEILTKSFKRLPEIRSAAAKPPLPKRNPVRQSETTQIAVVTAPVTPTPRPASAIADTAIQTANLGTAAVLPKAPTGQWGIQVGAFNDFEKAQSIAKTALESLGERASFASTNVEPYAQQNKRIYRARIVGMNESYAREACQSLRAENITCLPVPPQG
ncbi:D-alanyl-D-alanine carboxypeptidase family protein [Kiloniella sp. b19]|uniref:D-alanyl-D-alanine carboxypeptidase family protein n=1 Tax=Kiloniella sp. GXU_MW_B19 TaxID=3141326 RepID=UPI0031D5D60E